METFFTQSNVPVNSCILVNDAETARKFPVGDIVLGFCDECGFIRNLAFDPALTEYSGRYEETQGFSPTFNRFHSKLAEDLIERHDLYNKRVIEIGCGKGEFLALICKLGNNQGLGFDPSYDPDRGVLEGLPQVDVRREFFGPTSGTQDADAVVCKMTLEHIQQCADFVMASRRALDAGPETLAFFQIPESLRILKDCAFEDVYYEHCSYFTPGSAARLFRSVGFTVNRLDVTYGGQYLTLEASNEAPDACRTQVNEDSVDEVRGYVQNFDARYAEKKQFWRETVAETEGGPTVIWGSGSKGVSFLHTLHEPDAVAAAVDINPNRQGNYMLGTGQPIVSPQALLEIRPSLIIVMNAIYEKEITETCADLGVDADIVSLR